MEERKVTLTLDPADVASALVFLKGISDGHATACALCGLPSAPEFATLRRLIAAFERAIAD